MKGKTYLMSNQKQEFFVKTIELSINRKKQLFHLIYLIR